MNPARRLYRFGLRSAQRTASALGLNVALTRDYYSPLPVMAQLEKTRQRWDRPSAMTGVDLDLDAMRSLLARLYRDFGAEIQELPSYEESKGMAYGPALPFTTPNCYT